MTLLQRIAAEGQTRMNALRASGERGQGTLEYVGIAVLIGLIMVAIFRLDIDKTIESTVSDALKKITNGS